VFLGRVIIFWCFFRTGDNFWCFLGRRFRTRPYIRRPCNTISVSNFQLSKSPTHVFLVKMLPSFVKHIPDGHESGTFIALDLGGTNFRVLLVEMNPNNEETIMMDSQIYRIQKSLMVGTGEQLFDHIAGCMSDFIGRMGFADRKIACGFTFSFPCSQHSINSATLISWTKAELENFLDLK